MVPNIILRYMILQVNNEGLDLRPRQADEPLVGTDLAGGGLHQGAGLEELTMLGRGVWVWGLGPLSCFAGVEGLRCLEALRFSLVLAAVRV